MRQFIVRYGECAREEACALCGKAVVQRPGPQVSLVAGQAAVCRDCVKAHSPALSALLELAEVAERVGRASTHAPHWVPLEMLLALARASENYCTSAGGGRSGT
jgi:ribosome-binding protein aMBF1 (putative translation factor)